MYRGRPEAEPRRYIVFNNLPEECKDQTDLAYAVFLPGFGATPIDYSVGFPLFSELITSGQMCCFYGFMPYFSRLPFGGWWYTNNVHMQPENYLFFEVLSVIEHVMGDKVTKNVSKRSLVGHSMGGYGAIMNSLRTDMQFFGSTCGFNGGLYIWNLPAFQDAIHDSVIQEAIVRQQNFSGYCNYTQPPYRYYGDDVNFNTMIAMSLASVFHSDGSTAPYPNTPWFSPVLYNQECKGYLQAFGFQFWLDENGNRIDNLFKVAPWNSPEGFVQANFPSLQKSLSGNIFLSATYEDDVVDYKENVAFSATLTQYNISHTLFLYNGTHVDPFPGVAACFATFQPKLCYAPAPGPGGGSTTITVEKALFWGIIGIAAVFMIAIVGLLAFIFFRKGSYLAIE